jgi:uncharacterized protein DUF2513
MLGDGDKRRKISEGTYWALKETNPGLRITSEIHIQILGDALKRSSQLFNIWSLVHEEGEMMIRDMELMRKILFTIEEQYKAGQGFIWMLKIDGYDMPTISEHCDLLSQQGLVKDFKATMANGGIQGFRIGNLTTYGYDYLELIRNNDVWEKTKTEIEVRKRPNTFEEIAKIAGVFMGNVIKELNSYTHLARSWRIEQKSDEFSDVSNKPRGPGFESRRPDRLLYETWRVDNSLCLFRLMLKLLYPGKRTENAQFDHSIFGTWF